MIWLGLAVYQTDINCRAYKNCRQSQIFFKKNVAKLLTTKVLKVSCNFNFTMSYRYDILIKTTLCTAVFYTVQTEQAGDFLGPGRK